MLTDDIACSRASPEDAAGPAGTNAIDVYHQSSSEMFLSSMVQPSRAGQCHRVRHTSGLVYQKLSLPPMLCIVRTTTHTYLASPLTLRAGGTDPIGWTCVKCFHVPKYDLHS